MTEILLDVGAKSGMDRAELERRVSELVKIRDNQLSEFPFPEWEFPTDEENGDTTH